MSATGGIGLPPAPFRRYPAHPPRWNSAVILDPGLVPINLNTTGARTPPLERPQLQPPRQRSWQKGNHLIRAGGTFSRSDVNFFRDDGQVGLVEPAYLITQTSGLNMPAAYRPPACSGTLTTNCLPHQPEQQLEQPVCRRRSDLVDQGLVRWARAAPTWAHCLPARHSSIEVAYNTFSLYATDSWKITPTLTVNYGLNWSVECRPWMIPASRHFPCCLPNHHDPGARRLPGRA